MDILAMTLARNSYFCNGLFIFAMAILMGISAISFGRSSKGAILASYSPDGAMIFIYLTGVASLDWTDEDPCLI